MLTSRLRRASEYGWLKGTMEPVTTTVFARFLKEHGGAWRSMEGYEGGGGGLSVSVSRAAGVSGAPSA
jgi:hypothetical protein